MSSRVLRKRARVEYIDDVEEVIGRRDGNARSASAVAQPRHDNEGDEERKPQIHQLTKEDEEFWFKDGTVIIAAGHVEFRVYGGILAEHSSVFKDLLAKHDHPVRPVISMPGRIKVPCAVVSLEDSPEDLRYLLRAYMRGHNASFFTFESPSFHAISASIRLGQKYQIKRLYDQAVQYLRGIFTTDFNKWALLGSMYPQTFNDGYAIGVVNLARQAGELSMLPTALLACIALGANVIRGFVREDGTREHLSDDDLGLCIAAQRPLYTASTAAVLHTFAPGASPTCKNKDVCPKVIRSAMKELGGAHVAKMVALNGFSAAYHHFLPDGPNRLCAACQKTLGERQQKEALDVWNRLPTLLGIDVPGWGARAS